MTNKEIISWLLKGDVSIQYQTYRDLLDIDKPRLRKKIETEGWGRKFLSYRQPNGHWGQHFYQPKWTSTHYTLLDLKNLAIAPDNKAIKETLIGIFNNEKGADGGIRPMGATKKCDVCVNGMVLNYASYFQINKEFLTSVVDFLLAEKMDDGGFNCQSNRTGATHSSLHTTLSVLEGILEFQKNGYTYRLRELLKAKKESHEFILMHQLFRSDKTGEVIDPNFLKLAYPGRWRYDILKAMDYFQSARVSYDKRMDEALEVILRKRTEDRLWKLAANHVGQTHFEMEKVGKPSRWNTLRALRILKHYSKNDQTMDD
ncbi:MAG: hypothetical protein IM606_16750 [Cytophagales bacterium]|jgi:hypothetical protein|nr:hypothetical protein [Cytophagales bacterium]MCA6389141.1 hypothetical protein [Cytophagales bacterium]MCA6391991.1 hypothetical protein [Cytophagales bacterium]MCA6396834.1 hypothetical protein [Cytophagales bacterium]MCA6398288.1 hypothetical protein [Cytophagales bacterium]